MSIEDDNAHNEMLAAVHESQFGWSWIGPLATKTATEGRAIGGGPKKRLNIVPTRPKTTDGINPISWIRDSWRDRISNRNERAVTKAAERIVTRERRIVRIEKMGPAGLVVAMAFGAPALAPGIWKAAAEANTQVLPKDSSLMATKANERAVIKAANHTVRDAGARVQEEFFADVRHVIHEIDSIVPKALERQFGQFYSDPQQ